MHLHDTSKNDMDCIYNIVEFLLELDRYGYKECEIKGVCPIIILFINMLMSFTKNSASLFCLPAGYTETHRSSLSRTEAEPRLECLPCSLFTRSC